MSRFLKITFLLFILVLLGGIIWCEFNIDHITSKAKAYLEKEFSVRTNSKVKIGLIEYKFPVHFSLKDIDIHTKNAEKADFKVKAVIVSPGILRTLSEKKVIINTEIKGFVSSQLSGDISLDIGPADIIINSGDLKWEDTEFSRIQGNLNGTFPESFQGSISFLYNKEEIFLNFNKISGETNDYSITAASRDAVLRGTLFFDKNLLEIDSLKGAVFSLQTDLKGTINGFGTKNKIFKLAGGISGRIEDIPAFVLSKFNLKDAPGMQGAFVSEIETEFDNHRLELNGDVRSDKISIRENEFTGIKARIFLKDKVLDIQDVAFSAMGGSCRGKFKIDTESAAFPFLLQINTENIDFSSLPERFIGVKNKLKGKIDASFVLKGYFQEITEFIVNIKENRSDKAVLSNAGLKASFSSASIISDNIEFKNVEGNISCENGIFDVSDLKFTLFGGEFSCTLSADLKNPSFPFALEAHIKNMDTHSIAGEFIGHNKIKGKVDMDIAFSGNGLYIADVMKNLNGKTTKGNLSLPERSGVFFSSLQEDGLEKQDLQAEFSSETLYIDKIVLNNVKGALFLDSGRLSVPYFQSNIYKGTLFADFSAALSETGAPFNANASIKDVDFSLLSGIWDDKNAVKGTLNADINTSGYLRDILALSGYGEINVLDGDLGPMPLFTPLLGNIYSTMENVFPVFKKIEITSLSATFGIKDRKLTTDDLIMSGSDIDIVAQGSLGFDGSLDFTFENRLVMPEKVKEESWQVSIRNFIASFGKIISKTRLRGTVKEPKWEFEYFNHIGSQIGKNIHTFFKNILK